jgi:hypothetical protein
MIDIRQACCPQIEEFSIFIVETRSERHGLREFQGYHNLRGQDFDSKWPLEIYTNTSQCM